ncbi:hypothetical protein SALBM311S_08510 [Streptomyces alboniger]
MATAPPSGALAKASDAPMTWAWPSAMVSPRPVAPAAFRRPGAEPTGPVGEQFVGEAQAAVPYRHTGPRHLDLDGRPTMPVSVDDQVGDDPVKPARVGLGGQSAGRGELCPAARCGPATP